MDLAEHTLVAHWWANGQFKGRCSCGDRVSGVDRTAALARHLREVESKEAA